MFDPFGDYETAGYLRNTQGEKTLELIKIAEHQLFRAKLPEALEFLSAGKRIGYGDFLEVHRILFEGLYPWAGKDRAATLPDRAVTKGDVFFSHPRDCQKAVVEGLNLAQTAKQMATRPGFIMGMFAYGHPFLDGNGRTMLLVHAELCYRAKMSIDWIATAKAPYLDALTLELEEPNAGHLDNYLRPYVSKQIPRDAWLQAVSEMPGLDGANTGADESLPYSDPEVAKNYKEFEERRDYKIGDAADPAKE